MLASRKGFFMILPGWKDELAMSSVTLESTINDEKLWDDFYERMEPE